MVALLVVPFKYLYRQPGTFVSFDIQLNAAGAIDIKWNMLKKPISAFTTDISVVQLKKGIYFIRIRYSNNKQAVERFVKG